MIIKDFIKWLEKQPQHLEVSILEVDKGYDGGGDYYERAEFVCFDDPQMQASRTELSLKLGVE